MTKATLGERIVDLRTARSLNQKELARRIGLSAAQLSRIENGTALTISSDALTAMARVLQVSADYILGLTDLSMPKHSDIAQLRLSETAVRRLLEGTLDAEVLNRLLEHRGFPYLLNLVRIYFADTAALGVTARNEMIDFALGSLAAFSTAHPENKAEAAQDRAFLKAQKLGEHEAEIEKIKSVFMTILRDIKEDMERAAPIAPITGADAMRRILADLPQRGQRLPSREEIAAATANQTQALLGLDAETARQMQALMECIMAQVSAGEDGKKSE